tara:strand:+ start:8355 stop:9038 length:684 start_codon:yes stop_codon:yes gene_type:complete
MKYYSYDQNGIYNGSGNCQIDPLESEKQNKNIYLIPNNSTDKEPIFESGQIAVFNNGEWDIVEDIRGIYYHIETKEPVIIENINDDISLLTKENPNDKDIWNGSEWVYDIDNLRSLKKASIQAKTESLINELTFAHPNDSDVVFSASIGAGSLWDKLDAKKNIDGFFPLAKTQYNDEIHIIQDVAEFDTLTSILFATQKIVWDENAQLKQSLNNMTLQELSEFEDER